MVSTSDVIVIGAGLHGLSSALHLALSGYKVTIIEKDTAGRHASGANAGGVRQLGRALPEVPLAQAALTRWHTITDLVDDDCGFVNAGQIKVAETAEQLSVLVTRSKDVRDLGFQHEETIGTEELYDLLPALAPNCVGGLIVRSDGHANPFRTVQAFRRKVMSLGVIIQENSAVSSARFSGGLWKIDTPRNVFEAPVVINSAGAWGRQIAAMLGDAVPLKAQALMLMITERLAPFLKPVVGAAGRSLSFKQFDNGTVLIGGAYEGRVEKERNMAHVDFRGLAKNAAAASAIFPLMRQTKILRCWAAIEGQTPDNLPVIGKGSAQGVFHCFGFSAHGFALVPIVGMLVSELVEMGSASFALDDFSVSRFSKGLDAEYLDP